MSPSTAWLPLLLVLAGTCGDETSQHESTAISARPDDAKAGPDKPLFEDAFDGKLAEGWSWLRETKGYWRLREKGLEIRVEPGLAETVKSALLRDAPDRAATPFAAEVTIINEPSNQFEQAGIVWYRDGKPIVKLVKELVDGQLSVVLSGEGFFAKKPVSSKRLELRFEVDAKGFTGLYREKASDPWQKAGGAALPADLKPQLSLQCYHGPKDAEHWVRFERFKILPLQGS